MSLVADAAATEVFARVRSASSASFSSAISALRSAATERGTIRPATNRMQKTPATPAEVRMVIRVLSSVPAPVLVGSASGCG